MTCQLRTLWQKSTVIHSTAFKKRCMKETQDLASVSTPVEKTAETKLSLYFLRVSLKKYDFCENCVDKIT